MRTVTGMSPASRTKDDFLDLVDQAIYEIDEIMLCAQDEGDPEGYQYSAALPLFEQLHGQLKALHAAVGEGRHAFADGSDLAFMPLVRKWCDHIPFHDALGALNELHRKGAARARYGLRTLLR